MSNHQGETAAQAREPEGGKGETRRKTNEDCNGLDHEILIVRMVIVIVLFFVIMQKLVMRKAMATVMMVMIDGDEEGDGDGDDHNELVNSLLDVALRLRQTLQRLWVLQSLKHVQHLKSNQSETMKRFT